ncbi:hypothetical protein HW126_13375 [Salinispora sp. H7-4]|nr:hypothetical protein [Salinispora sp. H7-4]
MGLSVAGSALFLARSVGLSPRSVGVGLTIAALVGLIASVPFGRLADRRDLLALLFAVTGLFAPRLAQWAVSTRRPAAPTPERPPVRAGGG